MSYTSSLWITCKDEGAQHHEYRCPNSQQHIVSYDAPIFRTLQILKPYIDQGFRQQIIIHDDGSTDDTLERLKKFKQQGKYGKELMIISHKNNRGKIARFIEALQISLTGGYDNITLTDADMVYMPSLIVPRLTKETQKDYAAGYHMVHSEQGEYKGGDGYGGDDSEQGCIMGYQPEKKQAQAGDFYEMSDINTSGTRALHVPHTVKSLTEIAHGLGMQSIEELGGLYGYALEKLLKAAHIKTTRFMCVNADEYDSRFDHDGSHSVAPENIPLFLRAFRKDNKEKQSGSIKDTVASLLEPYLQHKFNTNKRIAL